MMAVRKAKTTLGRLFEIVDRPIQVHPRTTVVASAATVGSCLTLIGAGLKTPVLAVLACIAMYYLGGGVAELRFDHDVSYIVLAGGPLALVGSSIPVYNAFGLYTTPDGVSPTIPVLQAHPELGLWLIISVAGIAVLVLAVFSAVVEALGIAYGRVVGRGAR